MYEGLTLTSRMTRGLVRAIVLLLVAAPAAVHAQESWDAVFLKGNKIGYVHTFIEKVDEKGRPLFRVRQDQVFTFRRLNDTVVMKMMYGTIETPEGEVLRLDTRTRTSADDTRVHGDAIKGQMVLKMETGRSKQEQTIPWPKEVRGPYAAEQSMARKPMEEGESRDIKMYIPDLNRVVDFTFKAGPNVNTPLADNSVRPLRRVDQTASLDGKAREELNATLWVDSGGQVLKLESDLMGGIVMYRTTREGATLPSTKSMAQFDEIRSTIIAINKEIPEPRKVRQAQYRLTLKDGDPSQIFPSDFRQKITPDANKNSLILDITAVGPNEGEPAAADTAAQFIKPNGILTSDDRRVENLAKRAVGNATTPWEQAERISRWVFQNIRDKNFQIAFAPANEVARDLTGDCSEHAVLAAAMSRAVGIPSRIAVGLLYVNNERQGLKGFGYHVWHEVLINGRWVALDSSWDQTVADATHIKLSDSSMDGVAPFEAFLPIARVQGKLEIDPIFVR